MERQKAAGNHLVEIGYEVNRMNGILTALREERVASEKEIKRIKVAQHDAGRGFADSEKRLKEMVLLISKQEEALSGLRKQVKKEQEAISTLGEERKAALLKHEEDKKLLSMELEQMRAEYQRKNIILEAERTKRWESLAEKEVELDEKAEENRRYDEILGKKAQELRYIKQKLEEFHGKPLTRVKI